MLFFFFSSSHWESRHSRPARHTRTTTCYGDIWLAMPSDDSPSAHTTSSYLTVSRSILKQTGFVGTRIPPNRSVGCDGWMERRRLLFFCFLVVVG
jgi:hypothetical protein